ncbi:hypothetical protein Adt_23003 [Abeliophyllum distichum]|uniref:Uncharacterized protein n=1 Tax=Abeliophyllum distichum TaxID=126358 RepID=A0ABD1SCC2_9LAMI
MLLPPPSSSSVASCCQVDRRCSTTIIWPGPFSSPHNNRTQAKGKGVANEEAPREKKRGPSSLDCIGLMKDAKRAQLNNLLDNEDADYINIGSHQDKLDSTVLEMLPSVPTMAASGVYKFQSPFWALAEALLSRMFFKNDDPYTEACALVVGEGLALTASKRNLNKI